MNTHEIWRQEQAEGALPCRSLPLIAHCGTWHPLNTLPWACPWCGEVVGRVAPFVQYDASHKRKDEPRTRMRSKRCAD